jgi:hypothetical protein
VENAEALAPGELLSRMIGAYRKAAYYHDEGVFRASLRRGDEITEDSAPMAVTWFAPNQISLRAYQAAVVCDGERLQAKIIDDATNHLDGQIATRPVGDKLTLDDIFSDAVLRETLGGRLGLHPIQLELLLAEDPLAAFLKRDVTKRLLEPEQFDGRACHRLEANLQGRYVFWIDQESYVLRRFEYPGNALADPESDDAKLTITAEFPNATFARAESSGFTLAALGVETRNDAKLVRFFVVPPQPLATKMFGRKPEGYEFPTLDGGKVTPESLKGRIAVLAWFSNHPGSQACLQAIDAVVRRLGKENNVVFYPVSTEPTSVSNDELRRLAKSWGISASVVRDLGAFGRDAFDIRVAPSLVVMDGHGVVQIHESGANPQLASLVEEQLADLLKRLQDGEDFAAAILTQARTEEESYQLNLKAAGLESPVAAYVQPAEVAAESSPQQLTLKQRWKSDALTLPGNLWIETNGAAMRLAALDEGRRVVYFDAAGQVLDRIELNLPDEAAVSRMSTTVDGSNRRWYAGWALLGPQVHVFDAAWTKQVSYPPLDQEHEGIRDAMLVDLDGSGSPILTIGFWGLVGVQGVDLQGQRKWSNRDMTPVLSLAPTPRDVVGWRKALLAGNEGHLLQVNQYGNADPPVHVRSRAIHQVVAAEGAAERPTTLLGFSHTPEGNLLAIGLSRTYEEMWSYRLPAGAHTNELQFATSAKLFEGPGNTWVLAGPDGSVHLISDDGEFFDYFNHGRRLTGLAAAQSDGANLLFLATEHDVTAVELTRNAP